MTDLPPQLPHGELVEVLPDVFVVSGASHPVFGGRALRFSRNMVVVRDGGALTLVNTLRLDDDGLARLDGLGTVEHVVRLGYFHGRDDAFYARRSSPTIWSFPGMPHGRGVITDKELVPGEPGPFAHAEVFDFETAGIPEGLLLLQREGGLLMACDSLQVYADPDEYWDASTAALMRPAGSPRGVQVGPGWWNAGKPQASDFERLGALSFRHLVSAHGPPLWNEAHSAVTALARQVFGSGMH